MSVSKRMVERKKNLNLCLNVGSGVSGGTPLMWESPEAVLELGPHYGIALKASTVPSQSVLLV